MPQTAQDAALSNARQLTQTAEAASLLADTAQTSQSHLQAQQAHTNCASAWQTTGVPNVAGAISSNRASSHSASAATLKAAGR